MPLPSQRSTLGNFTLWEKQEIARIMGLSNREVFRELRSIMRGDNYSWTNISSRLQDRLERKLLRIEHFQPGNIPYEWNVLCDERVCWSLNGRPSFKNFAFNRTSLINLKIIPTQAGIGPEARGFIASNMDIRLKSLLSIDQAGILGGQELEFKAGSKEQPGYFYADGPEFRLEYIHDRVEI